MATRIHNLDRRVLAALPSMPRPVLSRLVSCLIERLDELDGDTDLEEEDDCCAAGDDRVIGGAAFDYGPGNFHVTGAGDTDDAEPDEPGARKHHVRRYRRDLCDVDRWGRATLVRTYQNPRLAFRTQR